MLRLSPCLALLVASFVVGGCRDREVTAYRVPKEAESAAVPAAKAGSTNAGDAGSKAPAAAAPAAPMAQPAAPMTVPAGMAALPMANAGGPELAWTAPSHWQARPAGAMRKATYAIPGDGGESDLSISSLSGPAGGEVANINRWRGQVGLAPLGNAEVLASIERVEHNGLKMGIVDLANPGSSPNRILGAMVPHGGGTWFFKITGPDALVAKEKPVFRKYLETLKPAQ